MGLDELRKQIDKPQPAGRRPSTPTYSKYNMQEAYGGKGCKSYWVTRYSGM